jgi:tetratricopeptide (TPR) repeat protein
LLGAGLPTPPSRSRLPAKIVSTAVIIAAMMFVYALVLRQKPVEEPMAAQQAYARKAWQQAADWARSRLKTDESDVNALRMLARTSIRMGKDSIAAAIYNGRLRTEPMEPEDYYLMGLSYTRQGDDELALKAWSKGIAKPPEHPEMLLSLANLLARRQHFDEAVELAGRLARIPGWEAAGSLLLGTARFSLEDYPAATVALQKGLERDPEATEAPLEASVYRKLLARSLLALGRPKDADSWLQPALLSSKDSAADPEAHWLASRSALQQGQRDRARDEIARSGTYRRDNPLLPEPSPYAGSARCTPCHRELSRAHDQTRHARTFHHGAELLALPRPDGPLVDPDHPEVTHRFVEDGKKLRVETKVDDRIYKTMIDYAYGTSDRYVTMVGRDGEGGYRAIRRSLFHEGKQTGWGRTSGDAGNTDKIQQVRGQPITVRDGVVRCLFCHVTNPREFRDPDKDGPGREAADAGIGCERCHGPGANHILASEADLTDRAIVNVGPVSAEAVTAQCSVCHIVGDATEMQHRREDPIWVRSSGATMTFSRCYTESAGALSCLTCHDPHKDAEHSPAFYEQKCLSCHSSASSAKSAATICKVNPNRDCLTCHMPKVPMPVLHTSLTNHYIRVHRETGAKQ